MRLTGSVRKLYRRLHALKTVSLISIIALLYLQVLIYKRRRPLVKLKTEERLVLKWIYARLPGKLRDSFLAVVQPDTLVRWHESVWDLVHRVRSAIGKFFSHKKSGRMLEYRSDLALIQQMRSENSWSPRRIQAELKLLDRDIPLTTVRRYLKRLFPDSPSLKRHRSRWLAFLRNHASKIIAMDFFTIKTFGFGTLYGFFLIHHQTRRILHFNVTFHPFATWVIQQLRDAFSWEAPFKYLIFDNDSIFNQAVKNAVRSLGIIPKNTSLCSPWQNPIAERWIGSARRDLFDHVIVFGENHARSLLKEYVGYYNSNRPHSSLCGQTPDGRPLSLAANKDTPIYGTPVLGGLHHVYKWEAEVEIA